MNQNNNIKEKILDAALCAGYESREPAGILERRSLYPFNPSAGHHIADPILLDQEPRNPIRFSLSELCFRELDSDKIGISNRHLSCFEMIEFSEVGDPTKIDFEHHTKTIVDILIKTLSLPKERIYVTVLEQCELDNLHITPQDTEILLNIWRKLLGEDHIILTRGRRNFFITRHPGSPGGIGYEIYFQRSDHDFIEIASQVNYRYLFQGPNNTSRLHNENLACGFGLERLCAVFEGKPNVHDASPIRPLKDVVLNYSSNSIDRTLCDESAAIIADHFRATCFIEYDSLLQSKQLDIAQLKIFNKMIKRVNSELLYLGIDGNSLYPALISKLVELNPEMKSSDQRLAELFTRNTYDI